MKRQNLNSIYCLGFKRSGPTLENSDTKVCCPLKKANPKLFQAILCQTIFYREGEILYEIYDNSSVGLSNRLAF